MAAAGYATGTVIQAIFNALGLTPDRVFEHIMKNPPPLRETGPTRDERRNARSRDTPQGETEFGFKAPPINDFYGGPGPGGR
jgi:hypothetical protein